MLKMLIEPPPSTGVGRALRLQETPDLGGGRAAGGGSGRSADDVTAGGAGGAVSRQTGGRGLPSHRAGTHVHDFAHSKLCKCTTDDSTCTFDHPGRSKKKKDPSFTFRCTDLRAPTPMSVCGSPVTSS